jgi:hypothetical protein
MMMVGLKRKALFGNIPNLRSLLLISAGWCFRQAHADICSGFMKNAELDPIGQSFVIGGETVNISLVNTTLATSTSAG